MTIYVYMQATKRIRPYEYDVLNKADIWATTTTSLTIVIGMFYLDEHSPDMEAQLVIIFIILVLLNAAFLFYWLLLIMPFIKEKVLKFLKTFRLK